MSQKALNDLLGIYEYVAQFNPTAAKELIDDINGKIASLAELGLTGTSRSDLLPGLRSFAYRERGIYFITDEARFTVLRVFHGRRKITGHDFIDSET